MSKYDVFGMCNPLYDLQAEVSEETLASLGYEKGSMSLIGHEQQRELVAAIYESLVNSEPGGSGANTMVGVAMLGGKPVYTGNVGKDEHARLYREGLEKRGVKPNLGSSDTDTGISVILITPDTQRTMCTYLGASLELGPEDVNEEDLVNSEYIYVTAYLWDTDRQKEAVLKAMSVANDNDVKVALSLSDPFCVGRHKDELKQLVQNHVNLVFGNFQEAQALTDTDTPEQAVRVLADYSDIAVVTMDSRGSLIYAEGDLHRIPAYPVKEVDTTGAGDMFAGGLLYGLTQGLPLDRTGKIASWCAAQVVAKLGPRLDSIDPAQISSL
jgi:sugar/nucleoside kinase (ribokinase family)